MNHLDQDQLTLLYFDEASTSQREHLAACGLCRKSYGQLAAFLNTLREVPLPEKGPEWEQRLWSQIAPGIAKTLHRPQRLRFQPWVFAPALAALLFAAFFIGRYTRPATPVTAFSAQARDRVLFITLGDHLDRSQIILAELVNAPEGKPLNIAAQQQIAGNLVGENRLLRQIVSGKGDRADSVVLDELERVLLDIAHSPTEVSPTELDRLRQRIESQGLLFKVRVVSSNVREKGLKL